MRLLLDTSALLWWLAGEGLTMVTRAKRFDDYKVSLLPA